MSTQQKREALRSIRLQLPLRLLPNIDKITAIFRRQVEMRCGARVLTWGKGELNIELEIIPNIGPEGFQIEDRVDGRIKIIGNDERGLLYGMGKFLRTSCYDKDGFIPGIWRGTSVPEKKVRGIYFATHFHNFYHDAPIEKVEQYVEDLALWGYNALMVWFDMHHFKGIDDPEAQKMIKRLKSILIAAKRIGIGIGLGVIANEGYGNSPQELRLTPPTQIKFRGMYGVELCPNKPGARELMLKWFTEEFEVFSDIGLDYLWIWPYDQGGCGCEKCRPWGANGFLLMAQPISNLARKIFPDIKIILSTWLFDAVENEGEWEGLTKIFAECPEWVDYILADSHTDFPKYPLEKGVPGKLPMLNFPEISMWGMHPWGGYGANPLPERFQKIWDGVSGLISGGFPYSEGIFEDINKIIVSQFYWSKNKKAMETLREYIAFEYSPEVVEEVSKAIKILEKNHRYFGDKSASGKIMSDAGASEAYEYIKKADAKLSLIVRNSWRWRILFLRALIDYERFQGHDLNEKCGDALNELIEIYHAENAESSVCPPVAKKNMGN